MNKKSTLLRGLLMWLVLTGLAAMGVISMPSLYETIVNGLTKLIIQLGYNPSNTFSLSVFAVMGGVMALSIAIIILILKLLILPFITWSKNKLGYISVAAFAPMAIFC